MNTNFNTTAAGNAAHQSFSRADYRLNYSDLNSMNEAPSYTDRLYATEEFPFLSDTVLWAVVSGIVRTRLTRMGVNEATSNVPFQGWAERFMRSAGLAGMKMPEQGFFARWAFRLRVKKLCAACFNDEINKDHGF